MRNWPASLIGASRERVAKSNLTSGYHVRHGVLILQILLTFAISHGRNPDRNVINGHTGICICKWLEHMRLRLARMRIYTITVMDFRIPAIKLAVDNRESNKFRQIFRQLSKAVFVYRNKIFHKFQFSFILWFNNYLAFDFILDQIQSFPILIKTKCNIWNNEITKDNKMIVYPNEYKACFIFYV